MGRRERELAVRSGRRQPRLPAVEVQGSVGRRAVLWRGPQSVVGWGWHRRAMAQRFQTEGWNRPVRRRRACGRRIHRPDPAGCRRIPGRGREGWRRPQYRPVRRFSPVGSRIPIEFATRSAMPVKVRHSSRRGFERPARLPHNPSCRASGRSVRLAHPAARRTQPLPAGSWGTVFPGLPPDGVGWPVALSASAAGTCLRVSRTSARRAAFATWVSSGLWGMVSPLLVLAIRVELAVPEFSTDLFRLAPGVSPAFWRSWAVRCTS